MPAGHPYLLRPRGTAQARPLSAVELRVAPRWSASVPTVVLFAASYRRWCSSQGKFVQSEALQLCDNPDQASLRSVKYFWVEDSEGRSSKGVKGKKLF